MIVLPQKCLRARPLGSATADRSTLPRHSSSRTCQKVEDIGTGVAKLLVATDVSVHRQVRLHLRPLSPHQSSIRELHPLPVPSAPWETISVDFIVELPESSSHVVWSRCHNGRSGLRHQESPLCPHAHHYHCFWDSYTVQGQGLALLALGSARPDPTRARVRARC